MSFCSEFTIFLQLPTLSFPSTLSILLLQWSLSLWTRSIIYCLWERSIIHVLYLCIFASCCKSLLITTYFKLYQERDKRCIYKWTLYICNIFAYILWIGSWFRGLGLILLQDKTFNLKGRRKTNMVGESPI